VTGTHIQADPFASLTTPNAVRHLPLTSLWPSGQGKSSGALTTFWYTVACWIARPWDCPSANTNIRNVHRSTALIDLHHSILNTTSEIFRIRWDYSCSCANLLQTDADTRSRANWKEHFVISCWYKVRWLEQTFFYLKQVHVLPDQLSWVK